MSWFHACAKIPRHASANIFMAHFSFSWRTGYRFVYANDTAMQFVERMQVILVALVFIDIGCCCCWWWLWWCEVWLYSHYQSRMQLHHEFHLNKLTKVDNTRSEHALQTQPHLSMLSLGPWCWAGSYVSRFCLKFESFHIWGVTYKTAMIVSLLANRCFAIRSSKVQLQ